MYFYAETFRVSSERSGPIAVVFLRKHLDILLLWQTDAGRDFLVRLWHEYQNFFAKVFQLPVFFWQRLLENMCVTNLPGGFMPKVLLPQYCLCCIAKYLVFANLLLGLQTTGRMIYCSEFNKVKLLGGRSETYWSPTGHQNDILFFLSWKTWQPSEFNWLQSLFLRTYWFFSLTFWRFVRPKKNLSSEIFWLS